MSSSFLAGNFWVCALTLSASAGSSDVCGLWGVYDLCPDHPGNALLRPRAIGTTKAFSDERDADVAARNAGRIRALELTEVSDVVLPRRLQSDGVRAPKHSGRSLAMAFNRYENEFSAEFTELLSVQALFPPTTH